VGSQWGRLVDMLMDAKCMNPVVYIDELDKISKTEHGKEIVGILTHLIDPSQNKDFADRYFAGIPLDFSKVLFIFSYNYIQNVDPVLRDRITEIEMGALNQNEKIKIVKDYILPTILKDIGYQKGDYFMENSTINNLIETYTQEAGVRKLKEKIFEMLRELNLREVRGYKMTFPYEITQEIMDELLTDSAKARYKKKADKPHIGKVNGLYATMAGTGGITLVEVQKIPSNVKFGLELTGMQGDVMQESMKCAKTVAWNLLPKKIKKEMKEEWDEMGPFSLHIHCPDGATSKDGPSAGAAITCGILSRLCGLHIRNDVALTGEIVLSGNVNPIGGVGAKVEGAKRAGIKKVLLPEENREDYEKYVKKLKETFSDLEKVDGSINVNFIKEIEVKFVSRIEDILKEIFVEDFFSLTNEIDIVEK